ncbi:Spc24 subunit of Ndc80-domain-containing protein [Lobosporangium transversale]|uniref:Kinetochore protein Spc24 n=1 Tax=Lobosporangium transversale TaxID=64571 RepID=A0A1Y2GC00_9FUNG|nr:Spc24 subunit of Ndc80-domain-containing protein [Lobosporangium transversale]ORZ06552.1 Spc24 subunit of Ndc80-domain-containing protein [Lobosporangium transversale]|eukprot:XP_021877595.1 Spc24 subunit of Ndc80-domain-containing protein [Lobosporangium transversale]
MTTVPALEQRDFATDESIVLQIQNITAQLQESSSNIQDIQRIIQEDARETELVRREALQDARLLLQRMSRNLELTRSEGSGQHIEAESLEHNTQMYEMDKKKFAIAKTIQNMDQDIVSLETAIHHLRMQSLKLGFSQKINNARNPHSDNKGAREEATTSNQEEDLPDDPEDIMDDTSHASTVLRLQLYRGLGIELLEDDVGVYSKARIRSNVRKDVHLVKLDDQLSPYFQTNLIWEFAS